MYLLQTTDNTYLRADGTTTVDRSVSKVFRSLEQAVTYCAEYVKRTGQYVFPRKYSEVPANNPVKLEAVKSSKPKLSERSKHSKRKHVDRFESMSMAELRNWCKSRMSPDTIRGWGEGNLRRKETYIRAAWVWFNTHAKNSQPTHIVTAA